MPSAGVVDRLAEVAAKQLITDALRDRKVSTGLLLDSEFIRQSTALVNSADDGIAYLVVGNSQAQQEAKQNIARLAEYIGRQIGLPPPQAHEVTARNGNGGKKA